MPARPRRPPGPPQQPPSGTAQLGRGSHPRPGVLVSANTRRLVSLAAEHDCVLRLAVQIGDCPPEGADLFEVCGAGLPDKPEDEHERRAWHTALYRHVAFETERTMQQDAAFGFRQLVDSALQALSPAVNAPTTAAQAIDEMHDLLTRPQLSGCYRDDDGKLQLVLPHMATTCGWR